MKEYYKIKVLEPTEIETKEGQKIVDSGNKVVRFSHYDVVQQLLDNPLWIKTYHTVKAATTIDNKFSEAEPGQEIVLKKHDYDNLVEAVERPKRVTANGVVDGYGFIPLVTYQIAPYLDAIMEAEKVEEEE